MSDLPEPTLEEIQKQALDALSSIKDLDALTQWKVTYLGRNSAVMNVFSSLGKLSAELRPVTGQKANLVKVALESAMGERTELIRQMELQKSLETESLDITLPGSAGTPRANSSRHAKPARDL